MNKQQILDHYKWGVPDGDYDIPWGSVIYLDVANDSIYEKFGLTGAQCWSPSGSAERTDADIPDDAIALTFNEEPDDEGQPIIARQDDVDEMWTWEDWAIIDACRIESDAISEGDTQ